MDFYDMVHGAYKRMQACRFDNHGYKCLVCGAQLGTSYLEERLYAVRCKDCKTITLLEARNPFVAEKTIGAKMEEATDNG